MSSIIVSIIRKNIVEFKRNIGAVALVVGLPLLFIAIFGVMFGRGGKTPTYPIVVVPDSSAVYQTFLRSVTDATDVGTKARYFTITEKTSEDEARQQVEKNKSVLYIKKSPTDQGVALVGDHKSQSFMVASAVLDKIAQSVWGQQSQIATIQPLPILEKANFSGFDYLFPGLLVYGLIMLLPYFAAILAMISESKEIFRYGNSQVKSWQIIAGFFITQILFSALQSVLLYAVAYFMFGFRAQGNLLDTMVIIFLTNSVVSGAALVLGSLVKKSDTASTVGSLLTVFLGFMSGSFIVGIENVMKIGEIDGKVIGLNHIFPTTFSTDALKQIMLFNQPLSQLGLEVAVLAVSAVVFLIVGSILFFQLQLKKSIK